jgi:sporulation protein YlmC with PRC-barrel domain
MANTKKAKRIGDLQNVEIPINIGRLIQNIAISEFKQMITMKNFIYYSLMPKSNVQRNVPTKTKKTFLIPHGLEIYSIN